MMDGQHTVGFVILTWNSARCIEACLQSIYRLDPEKLSGSIKVIDNGSADDTVSAVQKAFEAGKNSHFSGELIRLDKNYGTTYSRNIGIRKLMEEPDAPDYLCVLDSDTEVNTKAILALVGALQNKDCGIVGPRLHDRNMVYQQSGRNIPTVTEKLLKVLPFKTLQEKGNQMQMSIAEQGTGIVPVGYLMSACWMMRMELPSQIGFLDEKIFYAPEDVEYCIRCWKSGRQVWYCYDGDIIHDWQRISRKKLFSKHNYEHIKGLAYLFRKYHYLFRTDRIVRLPGHI